MKKPVAISVEPRCFSDDEVPEGWKLVTILDACEVNPPKPPKDFLPADAPVTFVPMPAVDADMGAITNPEIKPYLEVRNGFTSFRDGDVIMAKITPCMENGKAAIVHGMKNGIGFGSTEFHVMRSRGEILPEYLYYYIRQKSFRNEAESHFTGSVGQKRVPTDFIKQSVIPLPPLAEQQRIVARVEALLSHVDAAGDRLSRVPLIMKRFRQAVLAAACSGRVTEEWRDSYRKIEPSTLLFSKIQTCINQKYLESCETAKRTGGRRPKDEKNNKKSNKPVIDLPELPETWNYYRLEELSHLITDGTHVTPNYIDKGIPFLSVKNIRPFSISVDNIKLISPEEHYSINQRCNPEFQDILYTKVGSFGYAVQNKLGYPFSLFVSVALIKPVKEHFTPDYAEIVMNSPIIFKQANDRVSGSGTPDLHLIEIRDFRIPLPPLAEQREIVRRVGLLFERADAIEREVAAAGRRCERLTQAVMVKAFSGRF